LLELVIFCCLLVLITANAHADLLHNSNDTGSFSSKWPNGWGITGGQYGKFTCATCHEPNNQKNFKNIRRVIGTMNGDLWPNGQETVAVAFFNQTSMGDDTSKHNNSSRICEVCHSRNRFHNYSTGNNSAGLGHPNPKQVCTDCHKHNTGFKAACGGCHGNPPTTTASGGDYGLVGTPRPANALTAGQPGAHNTHVNTRTMVCDTCHYISNGGTKMPNQSGTIQIGFFGFGGKVTSGAYTPYTSASRGYPFASGTPNTTITAAVTDPAQANRCSNVYCHGGGAPGKAPLTGGTNQAPNWDGVNQNACGNCHGTTAAAPPTMGSHQKHAGAATGYSQSCDYCHPAIDISHVQGSVRWALQTANPLVGGAATYRDQASGATGELAPSDAYGQCANLYCHGNGTPTWGASLPADCTGCHGNDEFSAAPMQKNAHKAHVFNRSASFDHFDFKCQECHNGTVDATNRGVTNRTLHVNGSRDISWGATATKAGIQGYDGTGSSCATTYCHSNGRGGAPYVTPASWSTVADATEGTFTCNSCHGGFAGQANPMSTDRHTNHITTNPAGAVLHKGIACDKCHDMTVGPDGQSIDHADGLHINKSFNVTFAKFANRSGNYLSGTRTCQNTYCHGRSNPSWNTATVTACGACHRASNTTNQGLSSAHRKHYNTTTLPNSYTNEGWTNVNRSASANVFMCGTCHAVDPAVSHVNGPAMINGAAAEVIINLPFTIPPARQYPAGGVPVVTRGTTVVADGANYFYSMQTSCAVYCHSNGRGGAPVNVMNWDASTTTCGNCHNKSGDASPTWSGAHTKHLTSTVSTAATCNACHAATASGNNALISNRRDTHPNGFINITAGGLAGGAMRWTGTNCSNAYCHYNKVTPAWEGGSLAGACDGCHGGTAASATPMNKMGHKAHVNNTSTHFNGFNFKCNECHNSVVNSSNAIISTTLHVNGSSTVVWGPTSTGGGAYNAGACATIYCHSDGRGNYKPPTNWRTIADGTEGTIGCDYCHKGVTGDFKVMSSARHYNHVIASPPVGIRHAPIGCDKCHDLTVGADGKSIDPANSKHLSRTVNISFYKFSNRSGSWVSGTKTCNVTYCHGGSNPAWTTTTINTCGSCHASSASATRALSSSHGKHYNTTTNINKTVGWDNSNVSTTTAHIFRCGVCHNVYPETDHVSGPVSQNGAAAQIVFNIPTVPAGAARPNTFAYGTGQNTDGGGYIYSSGTTCDVYCHSDGRGGPSKQVFSWTATTFTCGYCHNGQGDGAASPTWSAPHTKHIRGYAEAGNANFSCNVCHQSTASSSTTISSRRAHINGFRNVSANTWAGGVWNGSACNNVYCHSDGKASPVYVANQTWTTIAGNCLGCHGNGTATGGNNSQLSGKHGKHLNAATYNMKCSGCHAKTVAVTDNITLKQYTGARYHLNKVRDVSINATYGGVWTSPSCASVYCHSSGASGTPSYANPNWSTLTTTCTSCHGGDASQASRMATNRHASHMNNTANLGINFACSTCHSSTVSGNTTIANYANHVNKLRDVSFSVYSGTASGTSPAITCSNTRCHAARNPVWNATVTTDHRCTKCHGAVGVTNPTPAQMAPGNGRDLDGSNSATSPSKDVQIGAHQQHLGGVSSTNIAAVRCLECHTVPNNATDNNHLGRRSAEVTFANASAARKNGAVPTWASAAGANAGTCTNVYCHGVAMPKGDISGTMRTGAIFWNQTSLRTRNSAPTKADCSVCHGAPPTTGSSAGTHSGKVFPADCNTCHGHLNNDGSFNNKALHINGTVEGSSGDCLGCHSSVQGSRVAVVGQFASQSHHVQGRGVATTDCYQCHWEANSDGSINSSYHGGSSSRGVGVSLVVWNGSTRPTTATVGTTYISYTANGKRDQIGKLNLHCLSCHKTANDAVEPFVAGSPTNKYSPEARLAIPKAKSSIQSRYSSTTTVPWSIYNYSTATGNQSRFGTNQKNRTTKALSAHGNAVNNQMPAWSATANGAGEDGNMTDYTVNGKSSNRNVLCYDCHNSHGSAAAGITSSYSSATGKYKGGLLKTTTAGQGGYNSTYAPVARTVTYTNYSSTTLKTSATINPGANICNDCHNDNTTAYKNTVTGKPWDIMRTYSSSRAIAGYWSTPYFDNYTINSAKRTAYKAGRANSNKDLRKPMGGHFGTSVNGTQAGHDKEINGLCTPCHDPHGVSKALGADRDHGVPLLKGTWVTSPYREDKADKPVVRGGGRNVPHLGLIGAVPGYHIDQNTFMKTPAPYNGGAATATTRSNQRRQAFRSFSNLSSAQTGTNMPNLSTANFAGLCLECHNQTTLTGSATRPAAASTWKTKERVHQSVAGWSATGSGTDNLNNRRHAFTCAKCHAPHVSRLPRLMVTNCLDQRHFGQSVSTTINSVATGTTMPGNIHQSTVTSARGAGRFPGGGSRYSGTPTSAQNPGGWWFQTNGAAGTTQPAAASYGSSCHNGATSGGTTYSPVNQRWNNKTQW
jgi:predicted CxxxxCH...CXXCH cytochrome family protein